MNNPQDFWTSVWTLAISPSTRPKISSSTVKAQITRHMLGDQRLQIHGINYLRGLKFKSLMLMKVGRALQNH